MSYLAGTALSSLSELLMIGGDREEEETMGHSWRSSQVMPWRERAG